MPEVEPQLRILNQTISRRNLLKGAAVIAGSGFLAEACGSNIREFSTEERNSLEKVWDQELQGNMFVTNDGKIFEALAGNISKFSTQDGKLLWSQGYWDFYTLRFLGYSEEVLLIGSKDKASEIDAASGNIKSQDINVGDVPTTLLNYKDKSQVYQEQALWSDDDYLIKLNNKGLVLYHKKGNRGAIGRLNVDLGFSTYDTYPAAEAVEIGKFVFFGVRRTLYSFDRGKEELAVEKEFTDQYYLKQLGQNRDALIVGTAKLGSLFIGAGPDRPDYVDYDINHVYVYKLSRVD